MYYTEVEQWNRTYSTDESRFGALLSLYETLCDLKQYCQLNLQGMLVL